MSHWLIKSEPEAYGWDDLEKDKSTVWDGVRNFQARNYLKQMKKKDNVLYYHSVKEKAVVGIAEVSKESFPDPTTEDDRWVAVEIKPVRKLKKAVTMDKMKTVKALAEIALFKQSRLSVMPLSEEAYDVIVKLSEEA